MFCKRPRPVTPQRITKGSTKKLRLSECSTSDEDIIENTSKTLMTLDGSLDSTKPSFDFLPDLPLISILEKVPLVDLLPLRVLNRRFKELATTCVIKQTKTLKLMSFYGSDLRLNHIRVRFDLSRFIEIDQNSFDFIIGIDEEIYRNWLCDEKCKPWTKPPEPWGRFLMLNQAQAADKLMATFPAITNLVIFDCLFSDNEIVKLLQTWAHTLTSLKLVIFEINFDWPLIFAILKDMPHLQDLSLFSLNGFDYRQNLPFLGRLKTFQFAFYDHVGGERQSWLSHLLGQLNPDVLEHVDVCMLTCKSYRRPFLRYNLNLLVKEQPAIAAKLRKLHFPSINQKFCNFIARKFPSLSWLDMELTCANDLRQISSLSGLKFLALRSNKRPYSQCPLAKESKQMIAKIRPFSLVRKLVLFDFTLSKMIVKDLFPNVTTVEKISREEITETGR